MTIKTTELHILLKEIAELTQWPLSREEAIEKGLDRYLYLDKYNGWNLLTVDVGSGGQSTAFGFDRARLTTKEMYHKLQGFIQGLKYPSKVNL